MTLPILRYTDEGGRRKRRCENGGEGRIDDENTNNHKDQPLVYAVLFYERGEDGKNERCGKKGSKTRMNAAFEHRLRLCDPTTSQAQRSSFCQAAESLLQPAVRDQRRDDAVTMAGSNDSRQADLEW